LACSSLKVLFIARSEASDQIPGPHQTQPIALVGGTVHTVSGAVLPGATLLFDEGRISAIGVNLSLPADAEVVDVTGKEVYPGMISAFSNIGLLEVSAVRASRDLWEVGDIKPNVRVASAINPDSELLPVARTNGVTTAHVVPQGGLIAGTSAVVHLDGWTTEDMMVETPAGIYVNWPSMDIDNWPEAEKKVEEQKKERDRRIQVLRDAFAQARAYTNARQAGSEAGHDSDLRWEAMIPVVEGRIPVFLFAYELRQIEAAVDWAEEEGISMVLVGGRDAWRVAALLAERDIAVIITNIFTLPARRWEAYDTSYTNALKLHQAGVRFCIANSKGASSERNLPYEAAMAAAFGLPREQALRAVTLYPAQILGVDDRLGSLEVGKEATLIVTDGDPLEITTQVERAFIRGRAVDLGSRHTQLYDKYRTKYKQMGLIKD
jgi:imidazolonepropionase-like amidohydrolase